MKFKKVFAAFAAAAMLAGCGSSSKGTTDIKKVKLGFIGPLTGAASQYGTAVKNAMTLAIKDYNKKNNASISAVYYDDKADSTEAVNDYNKLVDDDKITALIGPVTSGSALSVTAAASKNGTPILSPSASADKVTMNGTKAYDNVFRICTNDSYAGTYLAKKCKSDFGFKKVAILYNKELDYSAGLNAAFKTEAKNQNVSVVYDDAYTANTKDFATYISKIKASGCDSVYLPDYYENVVTIAKQLRDNGVNVPLFGADGWDGILDVKGVNASNFTGCYFTSGFDKDSTETVTKNFVSEYKKAYGGTPNMFAAMAYDAVNVMMQAINTAKSTDSAKICSVLKSIKVTEATCGAFTYDKNHNPVKEMVIVTVKNGKYKTVK